MSDRMFGTLAVSFCILVAVAQCSIASDCRKEGGTPVRGHDKAVECIKPVKSEAAK